MAGVKEAIFLSIIQFYMLTRNKLFCNAISYANKIIIILNKRILILDTLKYRIKGVLFNQGDFFVPCRALTAKIEKISSNNF